MSEALFDIVDPGSPIVASAIHDGHQVRPEVANLLALDEQERLREEDPFTAELAGVCSTRVIARRSRFEVDLNRPRDKCVYLQPADAWGIDVWREPPPRDFVERSLRQYEQFYREVESLLRRLVAEHHRVVVLDIHSYNHRRNGSSGPPAPPSENPEINIGTGSMDRGYWASLVDRFMDDLRRYDYCGRHLDVRENVKFRGGHFPQWIHRTFPATVCAIAIEVKKFFMDEWSGVPDLAQIAELKSALGATLPGLAQSLKSLRFGPAGRFAG